MKLNEIVADNNLAALKAELKKQGGWLGPEVIGGPADRDDPSDGQVATYQKYLDEFHYLELQLWSSGDSRVSRWAGGSESHDPSDFNDVAGMKKAIKFQTDRKDNEDEKQSIQSWRKHDTKYVVHDGQVITSDRLKGMVAEARKGDSSPIKFAVGAYEGGDMKRIAKYGLELLGTERVSGGNLSIIVKGPEKSIRKFFADIYEFDPNDEEIDELFFKNEAAAQKYLDYTSKNFDANGTLLRKAGGGRGKSNADVVKAHDKRDHTAMVDKAVKKAAEKGKPPGFVKLAGGPPRRR